MEIQSGAVAKSYMRKGLLIYEERRKYFPIYEEAVSHIWLCDCSIMNFLIYEENLIFFFISVRCMGKKGLRVCCACLDHQLAQHSVHDHIGHRLPKQKKLSWGRILGGNWDKRLKSFPPCYSQSPLLKDFTPPPPPRVKVVWNWFAM